MAARTRPLPSLLAVRAVKTRQWRALCDRQDLSAFLLFVIVPFLEFGYLALDVSITILMVQNSPETAIRGLLRIGYYRRLHIVHRERERKKK